MPASTLHLYERSQVGHRADWEADQPEFRSDRVITGVRHAEIRGLSVVGLGHLTYGNGE
jgi:predicted amino acid dehydrogenase